MADEWVDVEDGKQDEWVDVKPADTRAESIATNGIGFLAQHPFKTQFQPLAKTITGKSLEDMAREHVMSEEFTRPPPDAPFDRNLKFINPKASLEVGYAQNADLASAPINAFGGPIVKAGAKVIGAGADAVSKIPNMAGDISARIHNMMVRLPTKAYTYGKDPLKVLKDEKIVANTLTDYAQKAQDRLTQRSAELQDAVKNSDKTVDISDIMDKHINDAVKSAKGSLQDRSAILDKLDYMKSKLAKKYGDLSNIPIQKAVKLYRQLADDFPFSGNTEENIMAKTAHKMYHDIGAAVDVAHPEIADLNQKVSGLIDITKAVNNRVAVESRNNPVGLIGTILGSAVGAHGGGIVGGMEGGVATALALKGLSSPAVLTRVANAMARMSEIDRGAVFKSYPQLAKLLNGRLPKAPVETEDLTHMSSFGSTSPTGVTLDNAGKQSVLNDPIYGDFNPVKEQGKNKPPFSKIAPPIVGALAGTLAFSPPAEAKTIGQKNNNPINLKAFEKWDGMTGKDSFGHAQFKDLDHGIRAAIKNLNNHKAKNPTQSLDAYLNKFAEKNGSKEAQYIANQLGISPKTSLAKIDMTKVIPHLAKFESKMDITDQDIQRVIKKFNLK